MLVVTRRPGEAFDRRGRNDHRGRVSRNQVRIEVEADRRIPVDREEIRARQGNRHHEKSPSGSDVRPSVTECSSGARVGAERTFADITPPIRSDRTPIATIRPGIIPSVGKSAYGT